MPEGLLLPAVFSYLTLKPMSLAGQVMALMGTRRDDDDHDRDRDEDHVTLLFKIHLIEIKFASLDRKMVRNTLILMYKGWPIRDD